MPMRHLMSALMRLHTMNVHEVALVGRHTS